VAVADRQRFLDLLLRVLRRNLEDPEPQLRDLDAVAQLAEELKTAINR